MKQKLVFFLLFLNGMAQVTNGQETYAAQGNNNQKANRNKVVEINKSNASTSESNYYLTCPDDKHPHMIDLGLPSGTKWACCNVDADKPEDSGSFFAWGETEPKEKYNWATYTHCDGKVNTCHKIGDDIAGTEYDVAHVKWGGSWVMPSQTQQKELKENCTYEWTTENGVAGTKFTGKNGGSIFLPAAGYIATATKIQVGEYGYYWTSTQNSNMNAAYGIRINSDPKLTGWSQETRFQGFNVRPVCIQNSGADLNPIVKETTISTEGIGNENLTNNVIGDIYYNIGGENSGYDETDGSIVIGKTTNMSEITDATPGSDDVKNNFTGMILKVGAGKGTIKVNVKTDGNAQLVVQVGNGTPVKESKTERGDVVIDYDVQEDTYVYIYAVVGSSLSITRSITTENAVRIYSITITPNTTGIDAVYGPSTTTQGYYTLDGRKIQGQPTKKGIYIFNGRKVIVQ